MSLKKRMAKHVFKKTAAALYILLATVFLFGSRSTVMTVQAQEENAEAVAVMPEENMEETAAAIPEENTEEAQPQEAGMEEAPVIEENTEEIVQQTENPLEAMTVTMIGDSVMLGAAPSIQEMLPNCVIDAKVSRQVIQADDVLTSLEEQSALGQIVVLALGTNGPFSVEKGQELIDRLGSDRTICWVTVYGRELDWQEDSNAVIRELAANNENVHLIDWSQAVSEHAEWLCGDGIHLSVEGRNGYAGVVLERLFSIT